ncbi:hypothetical protein KID03_03420 [bacterium]|nr:hypothetical protein [bacterium]
MKINTSNITFTSSYKPSKEAKKYSQKQLIKYSSFGALGCIAGYAVPLKQIDGPDIINNTGATLNKLKTKVPNTVGKYKNAGWGILAGLSIAVITDFILKK